MRNFNKDVMIKITGTQNYGAGDDNVTELMSPGRFYKKNEAFFISYDETELTGFEGSKTVVKIEGEDKITMMRTGKNRSQLIIENRIRHLCHYNTDFGDMMIGVFGKDIRVKLDEAGGEVNFSYSLDINTALDSDNNVNIKIREIKNH